MNTTKPMTKQTNAERLKAVKVSVASAMKNHGDDVDLNTPKYYGMGIFKDADFLVKIIDQLTGGNADKLNKVQIDEEDVSAISAAA